MNSVNKCIACGHELMPDSGNYKLKGCRKCKRKIHDECYEVLLLGPRFLCHSIREPLVSPGVKQEVRVSIAEKPIRDSCRCLVCGDVESDSAVKIKCMENCGFWVHHKCIDVLANLNEERFIESEFSCNHVNYYIKPDEVNMLLSNNSNIIENARCAVERRGEINHTKYDVKRKRYVNGDLTCEKCGQVVSVNEEEHELRYCSARYLGTPIPTRDFEYTASKFKRIRRCALYDYPP